MHCMRFINKGFKAPTQKEIQGLVNLLGKLRRNQIKRNLKKVFEGTSGERNARKIAKSMGIKEDIFSFKTIEQLKAINK